MSEFSFGQVEATLAVINGIADHKRVAFTGRLKHLQKNGILGDRDRPGRGKAGIFGFSQLMQFAIGVELLKFGLPPQRAAQLVDRNWNTMRYSIYLATFTETEIKDRAEEYGHDAPCANWLWMVRDDALSELTTDGSSEYDTYEAIDAVPIDDVKSTFNMMTYLTDPKDRRTMLISGTALARTVIDQIAYGFRYATIEAMRADILDELKEFSDAVTKLDATFLDTMERVKAKMKARPQPPEVTDEQGADVLAHLSPEGLAMLTRFAHARSVMMTEGDSPNSLIELVEFGLFEIDLPSTEAGDPNMEVTELGLVTMKILRAKEAGNVSSKA